MNPSKRFCWSTRPTAVDPLWAIDDAWFARRFHAPQNLSIDMSREFDDEPQVYNGVAVIDVAGPMMKHASLFDRLFDGAVSMGEVQAQVRNAVNSDAVNAILMRYDSPGGTVAGLSDLADEIFEARKGKTIVSYVSDLAASAAYYAASQADRIYSDRDSLIGSIGTYVRILDMSAMADEMGIKVEVIKSAPGKGAGEPGTKLTDSQRAELQRIVDGLGRQFIEDVARGRGMDANDAEKWHTGKLYLASEALTMGLIDEIASFDTVFDTLQRQSLGQQPAMTTWSSAPAVHGGMRHESGVAQIS